MCMGVDVIRGFVMSGVTKPLRAYEELSTVCLYGLFFFLWALCFFKNSVLCELVSCLLDFVRFF